MPTAASRRLRDPVPAGTSRQSSPPHPTFLPPPFPTHGIEVKDEGDNDEEASDEPKEKTHVPRPNNPWISYRRHAVRVYNDSIMEGEKRMEQAELSKLISRQWAAESEEIKNQWRARAKQEAEAHKAANPGYVYKPVRKAVKKAQLAAERAAKKQEREALKQRQKAEKLATMPIFKSDAALGSLAGVVEGLRAHAAAVAAQKAAVSYSTASGPSSAVAGSSRNLAALAPWTDLPATPPSKTLSLVERCGPVGPSPPMALAFTPTGSPTPGAPMALPSESFATAPQLNARATPMPQPVFQQQQPAYEPQPLSAIEPEDSVLGIYDPAVPEPATVFQSYDAFPLDASGQASADAWSFNFDPATMSALDATLTAMDDPAPNATFNFDMAFTNDANNFAMPLDGTGNFFDPNFTMPMDFAAPGDNIVSELAHMPTFDMSGADATPLFDTNMIANVFDWTQYQDLIGTGPAPAPTLGDVANMAAAGEYPPPPMFNFNDYTSPPAAPEANVAPPMGGIDPSQAYPAPSMDQYFNFAALPEQQQFQPAQDAPTATPQDSTDYQQQYQPSHGVSVATTPVGSNYTTGPSVEAVDHLTALMVATDNQRHPSATYSAHTHTHTPAVSAAPTPVVHQQQEWLDVPAPPEPTSTYQPPPGATRTNRRRVAAQYNTGMLGRMEARVPS